MYQRNWHSIDTTLFWQRKLEKLYFRVCQTPVPSIGALQLHRKPFTILIQLAGQSSFLVNRSSFFSGAPEYQPPSKVKIESSTNPEHKFKLKSSIQMRKPHLKVSMPKHNLMKLCPPHQRLNNLNQEVVTMIFYLQSNKTCTPSMICIMWTSTIPCITLRPMYHYAPLRTHVIVAGDVTVKLNLKLTLTGDMQMAYMSV